MNPDAHCRNDRSASGFTLIEVLVSMVVTIIVLAVLANIVGISSRTDRETKASAKSSTSAYSLAAYFADDVNSAGAVVDSTGIARDVAGCGSSPAALRVAGPGKSQTVTLRSFVVVAASGSAKLERRECSGATVAAALVATPKVVSVVTDLDPAPGSVTVACDSDGQTPAVGDEGCQHVTMTVRTTSGRLVMVEGSVPSTPSPTPTTLPQPPRAPATGTCTIVASSSTWAASGGVAGGSGTTHAGDGLMYTYNDGNNRRGFFLFDLTSPCAEPDPAWPTLPGGRAIGSVTLQLAYMGNEGGCLGGHCAPHKIEVVDASAWSEGTLSGNNWPGVRTGSFGFNRGNQGSLTSHQDGVVTQAVTNWYAGTWPNRGFRLSRDAGGDTIKKSNRWASAHNGNEALRPRLVITWVQP